MPGLKRDKTRPSRVPPLPRDVRLKVIAKTVQETPPDAMRRSRATVAEAVGISPSSVGRIWADAGLKPHIVTGFKVSSAPMFEAKVTEIVGYTSTRRTVLCVGDKSRIRALDPIEPGLPPKKGRAATMTHDDKRHGTTRLFVAPRRTSSRVIGGCMPRHPYPLLWFARKPQEGRNGGPDRPPPDRPSGDKTPRHPHRARRPHKTPAMQAWLEKQTRFKLHFTPTRVSWPTLVARFFAGIAMTRIRRGSYSSVEDPEGVIRDCLLLHNLQPKPLSGARPPMTSSPANPARLIPSMTSGEIGKIRSTQNT